MKRRDLVKTTFVSSSAFSMRAWVPPTIVAVSLPAHAMTSVTRRYSGNASAVTQYSILTNWKVVAFENADESISVRAQNTDDTVRAAAIADEVGPAEPGWIDTACTEIGDIVDIGVSSISDSEITIRIYLNVLGVLEELIVTVPRNNTSISFPDILPTCNLS